MKLIQLIPKGDYSENHSPIMNLVNQNVLSLIPLKERQKKITMEHIAPMGYQLIATLKERHVNVDELPAMFDRVVEQVARGETPVIEAQPLPEGIKCLCECDFNK